MAETLAAIEQAAISLLKRAVELDTSKRFTESLICYQEGIQLLLDALKGATEEMKKQRFRKRIEEYMERAEILKKHIAKEKESGQYHEQIQVEEDSKGHSYERLFGRFLDDQVTEVQVEDPYIRSTHQVYNFLRLCELLVKSKGNIRLIKLTTGRDNQDAPLQDRRLNEIRESLQKCNVVLDVNYSTSLHDREIRLNNGWIIKIGRGLDYFKQANSKFSLGYCDFDLRQCHKTTVDIFHQKHTQTKYSAS